MSYKTSSEFVYEVIGDNEIILRQFRVLDISVSDPSIVNDNKDKVSVIISLIDGLEISKTDPEDANVLAHDGDVRVSIDGVETTKTLSDGTVSFNLTTDKPAGSTITVAADSLADHPAESDSATIEVVSQ